MSLKDWNLEASEEAGQQEELRRQKAERLAEERAEEVSHERRHSTKACLFDDEKNCMIPGAGICDDTCPLNMSCAPKEAT